MFMSDSISRPLIHRGLLMALLIGACGHLSAQAPEDAGDIRPPKGLVEIPQRKEVPVALWLGIGGGVLALTVALLVWRRRARRLKPKSPLQIALASLGDLENSRESITAEAFANTAAGILRQYIADRFGLAAPRRTTEEFLRDIGDSPLIAESDHLRAFLKSCDLAKFAGSNLDAAQRGELVRAARSFVTATAKPQAIQP